MAWPYYQFVDLDDAAKQARREALNRHGKVAHASVLALLAAVLAYRGAAWAERQNLTTLCIAAAPECEGTVDVRRADLQGFMAAAFPDVADVELERISILP